MKIKISPFGPVMVSALIVTHSYISLAALLAAAIHEAGHLLAARLCGIKLRELRLGIFGAELIPEKAICSYGREMILAAAGPLINIISAALILRFVRSTNTFISLFIAASLFLGILNLLPIADFDGGRVLSCILYKILPLRAASSLCKSISFLLIFALWSLSVYLLLRRSSSLSLFVFSLALFCKIFILQKIQIKGE